MRSFLFFIAVTILVSTSAHADFNSIEPLLNEVSQNVLNFNDSFTDKLGYPDDDYVVKKVSNSSLKLLGRGLENRSTHETLALACIVENCSSLRFVYFSGNHVDAYYFGSPIRVTSRGDAPSEEQTKNALKRVSVLFKEVKKDRGEQGFVRVSGGIFGGSVIAVAIIGASAMPALIATAGLGLASFILVKLNQSSFTLKPATASFDDVNGWNWSANAKRISAKNFEVMMTIDYVSGARRTEYDQWRSK